MIDIVGSCSYLIPVVGEGFDTPWAPLQTVLLMAMYNEASPRLKYVSFAEELLPFTDLLPSATCGWLMEFAYPMLMESENFSKVVMGGASTPPAVDARTS